MEKYNLVLDKPFLENEKVIWKEAGGTIFQAGFSMCYSIAKGKEKDLSIYLVSVPHVMGVHGFVLATDREEAEKIFAEFLKGVGVQETFPPQAVGFIRTKSEEHEMNYALEAMKLREEYNE